MRILRCSTAYILLFSVFAACSSSRDGTGPTPDPVASVRVSASDSSIDVGSTAQLTAVALDGTGAAMPNAHFKYTSSDVSVATVSANGVATGVSAGEAWLFATSGGIADSLALTVAAVVDNAIHVGPTRTYKTPCAAIAVAHANDVIEIDAA
ncbi:MAG: Ig-like domain-containing protein, partial [Gemmatimonadaceae bacterium]